jgi:hypothetical protein
MDNRIEKIKKVRLFLIDQIEGLSNEQLNRIVSSPENWATQKYKTGVLTLFFCLSFLGILLLE